MARLLMRVYECEHDHDLEYGYAALNDAGVPYRVLSARVDDEAEVGYVELAVEDERAAALVRAARASENGDLVAFDRL